MISIPVFSDSTYYDLQVVLDGVTYTLEFRWNDRASGWFLNILNADADEIIQAGIRVVVDFPLNLYRADRTPPGLLYARDTSGTRTDPGLKDLGDRVQFFYFEKADLAAFGL